MACNLSPSLVTNWPHKVKTIGINSSLMSTISCAVVVPFSVVIVFGGLIWITAARISVIDTKTIRVSNEKVTW